VTTSVNGVHVVRSVYRILQCVTCNFYVILLKISLTILNGNSFVRKIKQLCNVDIPYRAAFTHIATKSPAVARIADRTGYQ